MHEQRTRPGQPTVPHRITGADNQYLARQVAEGFIHCRYRDMHQTENVVAVHRIALGRRHRDRDTADTTGAMAAIVTGTGFGFDQIAAPTQIAGTEDRKSVV